MLLNNTISIILTVYNQENIIGDIFYGIMNNISPLTREVIVVIDGCIDKSEEIIKKQMWKYLTPVKIVYTPNVNEVKANNVGLKLSSCEYSIIVQDDCMITEKVFDARLLKPFKVVPNLLAVGGRTAEDTKLIGEELRFYNTIGADVKSDRNIFGIRDVVNRGPLMLNNKKLKQLNYLDEDFSPLSQDDTDLCIRAYKQFGYLVGSYWVEYLSESAWGKTRNNYDSLMLFDRAQKRNMQIIIDRHYAFIVGEKHPKDIIITE